MSICMDARIIGCHCMARGPSCQLVVGATRRILLTFSQLQVSPGVFLSSQNNFASGGRWRQRRALEIDRIPRMNRGPTGSFQQQSPLINTSPATTRTCCMPPSPSLPGASVQENTSVVFTTRGCPFCRRAKSTLTQHGVPFQEVFVDESPSLRDALVTATGRRTVPVVYIGGQYIGGSDELEEVVIGGKLPGLLGTPSKRLPEQLQMLMDEQSKSDGAKESPLQSPHFDGRSEARRLRLQSIAQAMGDPQTGVPRIKYPSCSWSSGQAFSGNSAIEWILRELPDVMNENAAQELGLELQEANLLHHVTFSKPFTADPDCFFRLHRDEPPLSSALNATCTWLGTSRPASEVAMELRTRMLDLYEVGLSADGKSVNYKQLAATSAFRAYVEAAEELQRVDLFALGRQERLAFWINVYNALVVHGMVVGLPPTNPFARLLFYKQNSYHIGGYDYSLDDIEHGVLRGNQIPPLSLFGRRVFQEKDQRRFQALPPVDPRIHFALNCGAKSCPPIKVYSAENLDVALDGAVAAFCEGEVMVNSSGTVTLSKLMDWYKSDFGSSDEERLLWLMPHLDHPKQETLQQLLQSGTYKIVFSEYDWAINE